MGFWNWLFGGGASKVVSKQLPSTMVAKEFGEVNVKKGPKETEVTFTILMEPVAAEGWQTGVAIDASGSMKGAFGKDIEPMPGRQVPQSIWAAYQRKGLYELDPFVTLDQKGVGELITMAIQRGKQANPALKIGICGEHAGDPASLAFFARLGIDYVSCSPYRVPIARLALAQAA